MQTINYLKNNTNIPFINMYTLKQTFGLPKHSLSKSFTYNNYSLIIIIPATHIVVICAILMMYVTDTMINILDQRQPSVSHSSLLTVKKKKNPKVNCNFKLPKLCRIVAIGK